MDRAALFNDRRFCFRMFIFVLGGLCLLGSGCTTTPQYRSKASSPVDGAQVRGSSEFHWTHWYKVKLEEVDGKKTNLSWWTDWTKPVLIDPGDRVIRVQCQFALDSSTDSVTADMTASLQAGHAYRLRCGIEDSSVAFWVEDTETRRKVGKQTLKVSTTPASPSQTAAGVTVFLLFRVLLLIGTGG